MFGTCKRKTKLNILIISQYFWPETFRINDLAIELKNRGYEVDVLTGMPNYPKGKLYEGYSWPKNRKQSFHGVNVYRVPLYCRRSGSSVHLALNYLSFVLSSCLLGPFFCRKKYDAVFVFEPSPFTIGITGVFFRFLQKTPMIFWVQDLWPETLQAAGQINSPFILNLVARMVRYVYRRSDKILVQSPGFLESVKQYGGNENIIEVFPNWAEELYQVMQLSDDDPRLNELPSGNTIMFAGNLGEAQSLSTIIEAAQYLKSRAFELSWIIIGDGRKFDWFKSEVQQNQLADDFYFLGRKPIEEMPAYFSLADLLLVTLKNEYIFSLTIPSKVQSYLACGKPIVASINGTGADVINSSGAGIAIPAEDGEALAEAILNLLGKERLELEEMGRAGREYYQEHFDRAALISRLEDIFLELRGKKI